MDVQFSSQLWVHRGRYNWSEIWATERIKGPQVLQAEQLSSSTKLKLQTTKRKIKTRAQLLLRWPRMVAQVQFSLWERYLHSTHSFSVISDNIGINYILPKTRLFVLHFYCTKYGFILQPL